MLTETYVLTETVFGPEHHSFIVTVAITCRLCGRPGNGTGKYLARGQDVRTQRSILSYDRSVFEFL